MSKKKPPEKIDNRDEVATTSAETAIDLAPIQEELVGVLQNLFKRQDLLGGDSNVIAVRVRHSLNGSVSGKADVGNAIESVLAERWEELSRQSPQFVAQAVMTGVRKKLEAVQVIEPNQAKVAASTSRPGNETAKVPEAVEDSNPALTKLLGYISQLKAPEAVLVALRRDIPSLGKQLKDPHVAGTARKNILKAAKKHPGNDDLIQELEAR
jgi:hypothetical protein